MAETIVKIGIIGLGARAETLLASIFKMSGVALRRGPSAWSVLPPRQRKNAA